MDMDEFLGIVLIVGCTALWAYAARATLDPNSPAFSKQFWWVAGVPYVVTCGIVVGIALGVQFAATLAEPLNWIVGGVTVALFPITYAVLSRAFGLKALGQAARTRIAEENRQRMAAAAPRRAA